MEPISAAILGIYGAMVLYATVMGIAGAKRHE